MKLVIKGDTPSQKNRKIISVNRATGRPFLRTADKVKEWQESANIQLLQQWKNLKVTEYPIDVNVVIYYGSMRRHDLDNALGSIMDALATAKIIEDDDTTHISQITIQHGGYSKDNPRAEIFIED